MLGYCCISTLNPKLKCSQGSTKTWLEAQPYNVARRKLLEKANSNLDNLKRLLHQNNANGIFAFRLPEQLLPQFDLGYYDISEFADKLLAIGQVANKFGMQLSQHPSQYFVLNSLRTDVVDKTIASLNSFADILDMMQLELTPNLTVHVGALNGYKCKTDALDMFCDNFHRLNSNAKRFLVVENDQSSFSVADCLYIHRQIGIPVVLDSAHHAFNSDNIPLAVAVKSVIPTWGSRIPKFHLSSEDEQTRHSHADYVTLDDYMSLAIPINKLGIDCCIMLETKLKDEALLRLRKEIDFY